MIKFITMICGVSAVLLPIWSFAQAPAVREACAADIAKFCSGAQDVPSRVQCMNAHRSELSEACRAARRAVREAHAATAERQEPSPHASSTSTATAVATATSTSSAPATSSGVGLDTVATRINGRSFPSAFQPWNHVENLQQPPGSPIPLSSKETPLLSQARHDLYWSGWGQLGLKLANGQKYPLESPEFSPESIQTALQNRATMLAANPNMVILSEVHYKTAPPEYLPADSPYWAPINTMGNRNLKRYGNRRLDLGNPALQDKVAAFCAALIRTGVYDGCMLDLWHDDDATARDSVSLIRKIRDAIGEKAILVANVNGRLPTRTASYLNGMYMEGFGARFFPDWQAAASNLMWGESHLHAPAITALEGWWQTTGRNDYSLMRQITTLSLVFSNGYVLFGDPNGPPDHLHDWYPFWDKSLGKPVGKLATLDRPDLSGAYTRQYEQGEVVFNPPSNHPVTINFPEWRRSASTNAVGRTFTPAAGDGDLFIALKPTK